MINYILNVYGTFCIIKRNFYPPFSVFSVSGLKQAGLKHCRGPTRRASLSSEQLTSAFYSQNFEKHTQVKEASLSQGCVLLTKAAPPPLVSQIENSCCSCDSARPQIRITGVGPNVCGTFSHKYKEHKMCCFNAGSS